MIPNFFKKRDNGCKKLENSRREGLNVLSKEVKLLEKVNQKWVSGVRAPKEILLFFKKMGKVFKEGGL